MTSKNAQWQDRWEFDKAAISDKSNYSDGVVIVITKVWNSYMIPCQRFEMGESLNLLADIYKKLLMKWKVINVVFL